MKRIALLLLIMSASLFAQSTYYIDYTATDDSGAGTKGDPWKRAPGMPSFGGSYSHAAGDTFIFKGGVTWPSAALPLTIGYSGSSGNIDTYRSATAADDWSGSTGQAIFDGEDTDAILISMTERSYVTIHDLHLKAFSSFGVNNSGGDYVTVSGCTLDDWTGTAATGIWGNGASSSSVLYMTVSDNNLDPAPGVRGSGGIGGGSATVGGSGNLTGIVISGNSIKRCAYAIELHGTVSGGEIYDNVITNSVDGGGAHETGINVQTDTTYQTDGLKIYRNWVDQSYGSGPLEISASDPNPASTLINVDIYNNVFITDNAAGEYGVASVWDAMYVRFFNNTVWAADYITVNFFPEGSEFKNNVLYSESHHTMIRTSGNAFSTVFASASDCDYNTYYRVGAAGDFDDDGTTRSWAWWQGTGGYDANGYMRNPGLVSPPTDMNLASDSDSIGIAVVNPGAGLYLDDYNGDVRGSLWDMGAIEYGTEAPPATGGFLFGGN